MPCFENVKQKKISALVANKKNILAAWALILF
jgi:hypothetical protein